MIRGLVALATVVVVVPSCDRSKSAAGEASAHGGGAAPAAVASASLAFLNTFEGEIDLAITDKEGSAQAPAPTALAVFVKSGKVRVDLPEKLNASIPFGGKAYALVDMNAKKAAVVSNARKQVIVLDLNTSGEMLKGLGAPPARAPGGAAASQGPKAKLTKTGQMDTIAGYKCENWDVTSDHREATVCVAEEGASWFQLPLTGIPTERLWMAELFDGKHFPLRMIGYDKTGASETQRVEVTKIDKKALAAGDFEYPPTYRVVDLAQLLGAMPGLMGGMPGMAGLPGMLGAPAKKGGPRLGSSESK